MAIKQPRDHLRRLPTRDELERALKAVVESAGIVEGTATVGEATPEHPLLTECRRLGDELGRMGIPWGFGVSVNTAEMRPGVMAEAIPVMLVAAGLLTQEQVDETVYTVMRAQMQQVIAAVKKQRASGLVLPNGTPIPADLVPRKPGGMND